jgi:hypothetical protein
MKKTWSRNSRVRLPLKGAIKDFNSAECFGSRSGLNPDSIRSVDSDSESGSRRAKLAHKNRIRNVMFWSAGCSFLRAEGFSRSLDVLYGDPQKNFTFFFSVNVLNFCLSKPCIRIRNQIRIGTQPKILAPDPESMNQDRKHWFLTTNTSHKSLTILTNTNQYYVNLPFISTFINRDLFTRKNTSFPKRTLMVVRGSKSANSCRELLVNMRVWRLGRLCSRPRNKKVNNFIWFTSKKNAT